MNGCAMVVIVIIVTIIIIFIIINVNISYLIENVMDYVVSVFGCLNVNTISVKCADVVFEQKRKRRRLYRERSLSPVIVDDSLQSSSSFSSSCLSSLLWKPPDHEDAKTTSGADDNQRCKVRFLRLLGLDPVPRSLRTRKLTRKNWTTLENK